MAQFPELPTRRLVAWQVALRCALARGDVNGARTLAARYSDLDAPIHDETLAILVLAAGRACPIDEEQRVAALLARDDELRAWIDAARPFLGNFGIDAVPPTTVRGVLL